MSRSTYAAVDRTDDVTSASRTVLELGPDDLKKIQRIADVFRELASALDMTQTVTALHGLSRVS